MTVEPQEESIARVAEFSDPFQPGSDGVENITMDDEVTFTERFVDMRSCDGKIPEIQGDDLIEEIIMVAP